MRAFQTRKVTNHGRFFKQEFKAAKRLRPSGFSVQSPGALSACNLVQLEGLTLNQEILAEAFCEGGLRCLFLVMADSFRSYPIPLCCCLRVRQGQKPHLGVWLSSRRELPCSLGCVIPPESRYLHKARFSADPT